MRRAFTVTRAIRLIPHGVDLALGDQVTYDDRHVLAQYRDGRLLKVVVLSPLGLKALAGAGLITDQC